MKSRRIEAIDLARGFAVLLMIVSHGVKGLLSFEGIPDWGMVPIHLITKISSSLFFLMFGVSLAVAYLPFTGTTEWSRKRKKLLLRALAILFTYKLLTVAEMAHLHPPADILRVLAYEGFPIYSEILGFYGLALLWIPFALPLWKRLPLALKLSVPLAFAVTAWLLQRASFWGINPLKAVLVEHEDFYTWGQFPRMVIVTVGLLLGEWVARSYFQNRERLKCSLALFALGAAMLVCFYALHRSDLGVELMALARNEGKHPPDLDFVLFSVGGALTTLGIVISGGRTLGRVFAPVRLIGSDPLQAFVFHITVLFVGYRYLLGLWNAVSYTQALALTAILLLGTALWIKALHWFRKESARA